MDGQILLLLVALQGCCFAGRETLLSSGDLVKHPVADYLNLDRDGNNVMIQLDPLDGTDLIFRLDSRPSPGGIDIENIREDNLVLSPYIPNTKFAQYIKVSFQYTHNDLCPDYGLVTGVQCEDAFSFAVVNDSTAQVDLRWSVLNGTKLSD